VDLAWVTASYQYCLYDLSSLRFVLSREIEKGNRRYPSFYALSVNDVALDRLAAGCFLIAVSTFLAALESFIARSVSAIDFAFSKAGVNV